MGPFDSLPEYTRAILKAHLASMGIGYEDCERPIIGVVNSWNEVCPGHYPLRDIAEHAKQGIRESGGVPLEFNTIALCDAFGQGNEGMRYTLPSREIIADSVEVMVRGEMIFSGLVFVTACDKITPAMLMAAARLDLPSIFVTSGPMNHLGDVGSKDAARRAFRAGKISEEQLVEESLSFYSGPGVCPFMGTANTMLVVAEALGMMLPGTSLLPCGTAGRLRASREAGRRVVELVKGGVLPSGILTRTAFINAIKVVMAVGGSLNTVLHIPAIAGEVGVPVTWDDFDAASRVTPFLTPITPNGPYSAKDLQLAGGVPAVLKEIASLVDLDVTTVGPKTLREVVAGAVRHGEEVIRPFERPLSREGGLAVLKGNLAETGGVVKQSAVPEDLWRFRGPARVFDSEEECTQAVTAGRIADGDVLVVRYEGPKGGPGMREMHRLTELVKELRVAVVTDGRFSGATGGLSVGYLTPEAYAGGTVALVQEGDQVSIDIARRRVDLLVSEEVLAERRRVWRRPERGTSNFLSHYRNRVGATASGARTR
jgi:dihydroxy-acid dehydratase